MKYKETGELDREVECDVCGKVTKCKLIRFEGEKQSKKYCSNCLEDIEDE